MATCAISAAATNAIPVEKSERAANELTLVRRAQRGDEEAFAALFQLHRRRVYSVCLSMTRDVFEAEDLTQEAFLQVFHKIGTFRGDSAFSSWLHRVSVNTVLMKRRRRKSPPMLSLDEPVSSDSPLRHEIGKPDLNLSGAIDRISLRGAIQALPAGCRKIFGLHEVHGYQHREIAELLHCSIGNSKSQLHKAKQKMRGLLFPKLEQHPTSECGTHDGREQRHGGDKQSPIGHYLDISETVQTLRRDSAASAPFNAA
jgi:RNA polymerase sigma-70 factor (ECF subfamily)